MIEIKCDLCELQLDSHITLLGNQNGLSFDSSTYKTYLFNLLHTQQRAKKLYSNKILRFVDDPYVLHGLQFTENDCIIIDEFNYAPSELNDLLLQIRAANAWLIVIGRLFIKQLEYSVDSIISFEIDDSNHITFSKYFKSSTQSDFKSDIVTCEDSTSIAAVYSNTLQIEVKPAFGRSNFYRIIKNSEVAFLIADKSKFGADLLNLLYCIKNNAARTKYILLFCPECFEQIVCEVANVDISNINNGETCYFDSEEFFEDAAESLAEWSKSNVTLSVTSIGAIYGFSNSKILENMLKFYNNDIVDKADMCYEINIGAISFTEFNNFTISKNAYLHKKAKSKTGALCKPKLMKV